MPKSLVVASVVLIYAFTTAGAHAQTPMPSTLGGGTVVSDLPGEGAGVARGEGGATVGRQRGGRTRPRLTKRCATRRRTGTRVCRYRRGGLLVRSCTRKRGQRRWHCTAPRARAADTMPMARISAVARQGRQNPALPAVGRIYLNDRGHCTGTLITRGVVVTAAHCVYAAAHEGQGGTNAYYDTRLLRFVPGNEYNGTTRYGSWAVAATYATQAYANGDIGADWGFIVLAPDASGRYAGDYVPGTFATRALVGGITAQTRMSRMGYPSEGGWLTPTYYYGHGQYFCVDTYNNVQVDHVGHHWLHFGAPHCPMNGGSSGGPNFVQMNDGSWAIVAVNNRAKRGPAPTFWGETASNTWFDQQFLSFYDTVFAILRGAQASTARNGIAAP